jgi:uncharacterized paraquat-inducible protein A
MRPADAPRSCYSCDYETVEPVIDCPRCGHLLRTARQVRRLGWVLAAMGLFLVLFMTGIMILIANIMARTGKPGSTESFSGGPLEAAMIFAVLGLVWVFGLTGLVGGIWQIKHGKRNRKLIRIILWLGAAFLVIATLIQILD